MSDTHEPIPAPPGGDVGQDRSQARKAGFTPMPERTPQPQREEREFSTGREAAAELAEKRRKKGHAEGAPRPVGYWTDDRSYIAPANETVDLNRASDDLQASRLRDATAKELDDRDDLANKVDKLRKDANIPTVIDHNAPPDMENPDPRLFGDLPRETYQPTEPQQPQLEQPQHQPAPPGVDPDLHQAFQNSRVRAAVETEVNKSHETARTAQAHYAHHVQAAQEIALGSINTVFPEMSGVKTPQAMQELLTKLKYSDPQRHQQAVTMLQGFERLHNERANMERQKQHFERQSFQRDAAVQDAAFNKSVSHLAPAQREAVAREAIAYAGSLGIDEPTLSHLIATSPIARHAAFRQMLVDAASHRLAQKNLAAHQRAQRAANIPHVQAPGHSNAGRHSAQNANLKALSAKLSQSGSAKDAAALLLASRNARKRG